MPGELVLVSKETPKFDELVEAFLARNFSKLASYAEAITSQKGAIQGLQLTLISLCRLGDFAKAYWLAQIAIDRIKPSDPWSADLIALAVGKSSLDNFISENIPKVQKCQATYYAGAANLSRGEIEAARRNFLACKEIDAPCLELFLAETELKALKKLAE